MSVSLFTSSTYTTSNNVRQNSTPVETAGSVAYSGNSGSIFTPSSSSSGTYC